ncbi:MAG: hypothetical protein P8X76_01150 [Maritimibacter sp.]
MILDSLITLTILVTGAVLWLPTLRKRPTWRAMITPLASIIGSGFLILGPVLNDAYGLYAPAAMLALCIMAWGFGTAIRYNILVIGERLDAGEARAAEGLASALLGFAYIVSVAYYLNLFGAFALSLTPWSTPLNARLATTAIYAVILGFGWTRGFKSLESMEYTSVALKLAIIAGLLLALGAYTGKLALAGGLDFNPPVRTGWQAITLGFGLIVTVQGFETSRYLGRSYGPEVRIRSMRLAQIIATLIYVVYILFAAYSFSPGEVQLSETAIVDMMAVVSPILPYFLVAAALAAQFSAAVADTSGSGGLISELTRGKLPPKRAYAITVLAGLVLTWSADVFQIIAYASRAFAAYYAVQAGLAAWRASNNRAWLQAVTFAGFAILGAAIVIFGQPVE